ncbi:MAG: ArsA family ATPase [Cyclobacteriaceae bacterium]|nr:ArsA family ATPase [Cyclobacteriaceae bacterium]
MRIILFTGKGGVGKTTIAAATALQAAKNGYKTLVISTDPAHSLSDAFDKILGPEPLQVTENLFAQELDVYYSMKKYWGNIRQLMITVFKWRGIQNALAEEMSALPGMEEASAFLWIEKYYTEKAYDLIIIDSAPTGETLTLLTLPQVTKWWVTKALPLQRFAIKNVGRVARLATGIPVDRGYEELENIFEKLENIQKIFSDPAICSIRIVANPERMVINESKRAYTYLSLYGYNVDALIVNRVWQAGKTPDVFKELIDKQAIHLEELKDIFGELPYFEVPHMGTEVFGEEMLTQMAEIIYHGKDPVDVLYHEKPFDIKNKGNQYEMRIRLPFIEEGGYDLQKFGDELVIQIKNRRKNVILPRFVQFYELAGHRLEKPWLVIDLKPGKI